MNKEEWLYYGWEKGWCGPPVCYIHDGIPTTDIEDAELDEGDPCLHIVRLYESTAHGEAVMYNHSPSIWRASNRGWDDKDG